MIFYLFQDNLAGFNNLVTPIFSFLSFIGILWTIKASLKQHQSNLLVGKYYSTEATFQKLIDDFSKLVYNSNIAYTLNNEEIQYVNRNEPKQYFGEMAFRQFLFDIENTKDIKKSDLFYIYALESLLTNLYITLIEIKELSNELKRKYITEVNTFYSIKRIVNLVYNISYERNYFKINIDDHKNSELIIKLFTNIDNLQAASNELNFTTPPKSSPVGST